MTLEILQQSLQNLRQRQASVRSQDLQLTGAIAVVEELIDLEVKATAPAPIPAPAPAPEEVTPS